MWHDVHTSKQTISTIQLASVRLAPIILLIFPLCPTVLDNVG